MKRLLVLNMVFVLFTIIISGCSMGNGNLKGTVTWQYNKIIGTREDVGAKVILIPEEFNFNKSSDEKDFYISNKIPQDSGIFVTKVDGHGDYEINSIPSGKYFLILISEKTNRDITKPLNMYKDMLSKTVHDWESFQLFALGTKQFNIEEITIEANQTLNKSHDFGFTYF